MMLKKTVHLIAAARPNFMKIAPLYHALKKEAWAEPLIVHTGQHYDINMSDAFLPIYVCRRPTCIWGWAVGAMPSRPAR
jgi:UDP-N-acetylglucosamine 2-epimerase (non-hydrolysing)